jgi:hypothetical protein
MKPTPSTDKKYFHYSWVDGSKMVDEDVTKEVLSKPYAGVTGDSF